MGSEMCIRDRSNVLGNYGRIFAEYVHLEGFRNDRLKKYISIEGFEHLNYLKLSKKKAIFMFFQTTIAYLFLILGNVACCLGRR